jgi:hypothetical protein
MDSNGLEPNFRRIGRGRVEEDAGSFRLLNDDHDPST